MNSSPFIGYDEDLGKFKDDIINVESAYKLFIQSRDLNIDDVPSIFEFIESNKIDLSSYFSKRETAIIQEGKYLICAEFTVV